MKWPGEFVSVSFPVALDDVTAGNPKVKKRDFASEGPLAIVDQGQDPIAGYAGDEALAFNGELPVIVFGDHTCAFKYVDFPFALGADGVRILAPRKGYVAKFLYYFLLSSPVAATGYSRHFKYLKVKRFPVVPPSEQCKIVELLDQADALRKRRAEADKKAERILPALFYKMFGDPSTNPMGWKTLPLPQVVDIGTRLVDPNEAPYLDLLHIGGDNIEKDSGRIVDAQSVRNSSLKSGKFTFTNDHILYCKIRPYLNKVAYPRFAGVCSADIYPLLPIRMGVTQWYLVALLRSRAFLEFAKVHSERLRMPKLNREQLGAFAVPVPPPELVNAFTAIAHRLDKLHSDRFSAGDRVSTMFDTMLHRAFSGDLTAKWREAHMKELLREMEIQARELRLDGVEV
jgi:type I restriction enzyme S subunit